MDAKTTLHLGIDEDVYKREVEVAELAEEATLGDLVDALRTDNPHIFDRPLQRTVLADDGKSIDQKQHVRGVSITVDELTTPDDQIEALARGELPLADGFDFPLGKPNANGYYVASPMAEDQYRQEFGFWHTGEDWNGVGGGDSDLGDPVYAIANGKVVNVGYYTPAWGNIVLIEHKLPAGETVWSQYAHLRDVFVQTGSIISRGQTVGTVGKGANNVWVAHLHFEIRKANLPPQQWGYVTDEDRNRLLRDYHYPSQFINGHRPGYVSGIVVSENSSQFVRSDSDYWFQGNFGHNRRSYWTWTVRDPKDEECIGVWYPKITESGKYELFAFVPSDNATTENAQYEIVHRHGIARASVVQNDYYDQWVSLGSYFFAPDRPATVRLSDVTGEPNASTNQDYRKVAFDALMWTRVG